MIGALISKNGAVAQQVMMLGYVASATPSRSDLPKGLPCIDKKKIPHFSMSARRDRAVHRSKSRPGTSRGSMCQQDDKMEKMTDLLV